MYICYTLCSIIKKYKKKRGEGLRIEEKKIKNVILNPIWWDGSYVYEGATRVTVAV